MMAGLDFFSPDEAIPKPATVYNQPPCRRVRRDRALLETEIGEDCYLFRIAKRYYLVTDALGVQAEPVFQSEHATV